VAVLRGASSIDWDTTIIAACSFLLHFLALGAIYSDWLDPVIDDDISVAGLIDSIRALPPPPEIEEAPQPDATDKAEVKEKEAPTAAKKPAPGAKMSAREAAALSRDLEQLEMAIIGNLTNTGPATAGVLRGGDLSFSALDAAALSAAGVGIGSGDLRFGGGGGTIRPGALGGDLAQIGATGRGTGTEGTGAAVKVAGPKGNANVAAPSVAGGTITNVARVVAGMRPGFRNCYNRGLQENPDAQGNIKLSITVGAGGEVTNVTATPSGHLPPSVIACVTARARAAAFDPPDGGSAVVVVPVTLVKQ
jgi:outer membrane biosynthesis protein TonB